MSSATHDKSKLPRGATRQAMEALAETIIPSEGPERPGASDIGLADKLMAWLDTIPGAGRLFVLVCWCWEFSPLLSLRFRRFSSLPFEERTRVLEGFENSKLSIKRWLLLGLKMVFQAAFYNDPLVHEKIGYSEGCLSDPPEKTAEA